jgi:hypothetical protein
MAPYRKCILHKLNLCHKTRYKKKQLPKSENAEQVKFISIPDDKCIREQYEENLCFWVGEGLKIPKCASICHTHFEAYDVDLNKKNHVLVNKFVLPTALDWREVVQVYDGPLSARARHQISQETGDRRRTSTPPPLPTSSTSSSARPSTTSASSAPVLCNRDTPHRCCSEANPAVLVNTFHLLLSCLSLAKSP